MRFSRSILAMAAVAALGFSGFVLPLAAQAQDVKSADAIVKGVAPVKTHRAINALHALAGAVRLIFLGSDKPPAQRHYPKRHAYLENALMSREMDRL